MSYDDIVTADRRLVILRALSQDVDYTLNEFVLLEAIGVHGHRVSRDRMRADLAWLQEQELVLAQQPGGVWVVTLTARGYDTAQGLAHVPGVARPRPQ